MDVKPLLHPGSQSFVTSSSQIQSHHHHHHHEASSRFIVTVTFLIGNALTLVPTSILRRDSPTFRALTSSIMLAFASAFVSLLLIHYKKAGLAARICRWSSVVAMAAVLVLLLSVSALHQWWIRTFRLVPKRRRRDDTVPPRVRSWAIAATTKKEEEEEEIVVFWTFLVLMTPTLSLALSLSHVRPAMDFCIAACKNQMRLREVNGKWAWIDWKCRGKPLFREN